MEEIAAVTDNLDAKVVALSLVYPNDDPQLKLDLVNLKKMLPEKISLIVGGRAAGGYMDILDEIGAIKINNTKQLRVELEAIREQKYN